MTGWRGGRWAAPAALLLALAIVAACSGKPATDKGRAEENIAAAETVRIVFDLPGDEIGSPEYAADLAKVSSALVRSDFGTIVSSGFGMGSMEVVLEIEGEVSREALQRVVAENLPGRRFTIEEVTP